MVIKISLTEKQQGGGSPAAKTHWPKACPPTQGSSALCGQERWLKCCCWTISFVPEAFTPPPSLPNGSWLSLCSLCCCFLSPSPKQESDSHSDHTRVCKFTSSFFYCVYSNVVIHLACVRLIAGTLLTSASRRSRCRLDIINNSWIWLHREKSFPCQC